MNNSYNVTKYNNDSISDISKCTDIKDSISIATAFLSALLLFSEIMPFIKPKERCNGLIHALYGFLVNHNIIHPNNDNP